MKLPTVGAMDCIAGMNGPAVCVGELIMPFVTVMACPYCVPIAPGGNGNPCIVCEL